MCPLLCRPFVLSDYGPGSYFQAWASSPSQAGEEGGSGQSLRLGGEVQILATGFFPLGLLMAQLIILSPFQKPKAILCPALSALVVYLKAVTPTASLIREHYHFYETSSFSETKAKSLIKEVGQDQEGGMEMGWVKSGLDVAGGWVPRKRMREQRDDKLRNPPDQVWGQEVNSGLQGLGKDSWGRWLRMEQTVTALGDAERGVK